MVCLRHYWDFPEFFIFLLMKSSVGDLIGIAELTISDASILFVVWNILLGFSLVVTLAKMKLIKEIHFKDKLVIARDLVVLTMSSIWKCLNHVWILSTFTSIRHALLNLDLILSKPCMAKSQQSDNEMKSLLTNCLVSEAKIVCSVTFVQMLVIRQDETALQLHPVRDCINLHVLG